jgi:stearoyl-CoA desaturase (delta-9 desaturase)
VDARARAGSLAAPPPLPALPPSRPPLAQGGSNLVTRAISAAQRSGLALALVSAGVAAAVYFGRVNELLKYWVVPLLCMHLQLGTFTETTSRGSWPSYLLLHPSMQAHAGSDDNLSKAAGATPAYAVKSLHLAAAAQAALPGSASFAGMWASLTRFVVVSGKREFVLWPLGAALGVLCSPWAREALAINDGPWQLTMQSTTDWMARHYEVPFALVATYLIGIYVGTKLMASREPFDLKVPLAAWNFLLSAGSLVGLVMALHLALTALAKDGPHALACDNSIWWGNPSVMLFCLSKVPELVDTGFIVLRKKPLHFLHYYHHATVLLFCWDAWVVNNAVGGVFAIMNLFVHSVMYAYYCAAAVGLRFPQILRKNITNLQLTQMVLGCSLCVYNMCNCNRTPANNKFGLAMYASYFALFLNFWVQQYVLAPKAKRAAAAKAKAEAEGEAAGAATAASATSTTATAAADKTARKTAITYPAITAPPGSTPEELVNEGGSKYFLSTPNYVMGTYITVVHVLALWACTLLPGAHLKTVAWAALLWPISGFGITGGAHRLWAHKAYKAKLPFRFATMVANSIANQGTIYHWVRDHRTHHLHSETDADPHNALRGFTFAHVGWLYLKKRNAVYEAGNKVDMSDIKADPVCALQKKLDPVWNMFWCFLFPAIVATAGWGESFGTGVLIAGFLRYAVVLHFTWLVNSAAHLFGDRPYDEGSNPSENFTVAVASLGEGWHNWHHKYAFDYAASEYGVGLQFNPTKLIIDAGWLVGQTYDHKRATGIWEREVKRKDERETETMKLTIPKDETAVTLRSIKAAIPKDCFEHSYLLSFFHLAQDLALVGGCVAAVLYAQATLPAWAMLLVWPTYWFYCGLFGTGLWVLAHECGHGGFVKSQRVNDVVGFAVHSFLLTPYYSWQITHAKHHRRTNHLTDGTSSARAPVALRARLRSLSRGALALPRARAHPPAPPFLPPVSSALCARRRDVGPVDRQPLLEEGAVVQEPPGHHLPDCARLARRLVGLPAQQRQRCARKPLPPPREPCCACRDSRSRVPSARALRSRLSPPVSPPPPPVLPPSPPRRRPQEQGPVALQPQGAGPLLRQGGVEGERIQRGHGRDARRTRVRRLRLWPQAGGARVPVASDDRQHLPDLHHLHAAHARRGAALRQRRVDVAARRAGDGRPIPRRVVRRARASHHRLARLPPPLLGHALLRRQEGHPVHQGALRQVLPLARLHLRRLRLPRLLARLLHDDEEVPCRQREWRRPLLVLQVDRGLPQTPSLLQPS